MFLMTKIRLLLNQGALYFDAHESLLLIKKLFIFLLSLFSNKNSRMMCTKMVLIFIIFDIQKGNEMFSNSKMKFQVST